MLYKTEQENFWAGEFGVEYTNRNKGDNCIASNLALFSRILSLTESIKSVLELGSNIGLNLHTIHRLLPDSSLTAVEINSNTVMELKKFEYIEAIHSSILDFSTERKWDLVFTKGVLIHLNPNFLQSVYELMYKISSCYVLICEYYNPTPVELTYRGHKERLFKRDFAGEIMKKYPDLKLVDYGFVYHNDPNFPQDDLTWFLLRKTQK